MLLLLDCYFVFNASMSPQIGLLAPMFSSINKTSFVYLVLNEVCNHYRVLLVPGAIQFVCSHNPLQLTRLISVLCFLFAKKMNNTFTLVPGSD